MPRSCSFWVLVVLGIALLREGETFEPKPIRESPSPTPSRPAIKSDSGPTSKLRTKAESHRVPGEYIVVLKPDYDINTFMDSHSPTVQASGANSSILSVFTTVVKGFSARLSPELLQRFLEMEEVSYIEENSIVWAQYSWGIDRVNQRRLPLDLNAYYDGGGKGVSVYILDTGISPNNIFFGDRAVVGTDTVGGQEGIDCRGHGTHVAGTIGADSYGIARAATLYGVRVLNCYGRGTLTETIEGLNWVRQNARKPAIVSMSLGSVGSDAVDDAVNNVFNYGITVVASAGNDRMDACTFSPARNPNVLTVAATEDNDERATFSNYGDCVDLYAPGVDIISTWYTGRNATATMSGTSMSCPHVTGAAAIILGEHNSYSPQQVMDKIINDTTNTVRNAYPASNNKLLYIAPRQYGQSSRLKGTPVIFVPLCLMVLMVTRRKN
ncbi:extracellular serine proteinase-like [Diadema setosum]|uniref:extracellular serine proteinase-like n=1 Tax=Diadema setosum TaxID=31175 RepID=UPI003B3B99E9